MKKIVTVLLCLCLLVTGCQKGEKQQASAPATAAPTTSDAKQESMTQKLITLNKEWSVVQTLDSVSADYEIPTYEAKVIPYTIEKDLSNVENIGQFTGFTAKQKKMLVQNGFVVLPTMNTKVYYTYDGNEYSGVPNFVTADSALHLYHQFYDKSLMSVEAGYLYQDLDTMTKQLLDHSILLYDELQDSDLKKLQEQNIVYFLVARMLFTQTVNYPSGVERELLKLAKQEYDLCQAAEGYKKSPLFGTDFDYSQFTVRGHYTRSDKLGNYFKTMMWLGTAPYAFEDKGTLQYDNIYRALLIAFTVFADSESTCDAKLWEDIYQPTTQYVGVSDDLNVFDVNGLRLSVYGNIDDPDIFNDAAYQDKLARAVKELPEPRIQAQLESLSSPTGRQFRFMGQRYTPDSDIIQKLINATDQPIPSTLDVMGVLGNSTAKDLLFNQYQVQKDWPGITDIFGKLETEFADLPTDYWNSNLYTGWLGAIKELNKDYAPDSGMPLFMTTEAWRYKSLNTALGSFTELKHDSVLYSKQAVAEAGGPEATADQHYVEPEVSLYYKLLYLTDNTLTLLKQKGMLNDKISEAAGSYQELLNLLIDCSIKELKNEALNDDEKKNLLWIGGKMEDILLNLQMAVAQEDNISIDPSDMLVTDISTCKQTYLSLGTGFFDDIYVIVPVDHKLYLTRGSVYSFYEFTSGERLTDEKWWELNGIKITHDDYGDYYNIEEPSASRPNQPEWISHFKSIKNNVKIKPLEVDWDNLSE